MMKLIPDPLALMNLLTFGSLPTLIRDKEIELFILPETAMAVRRPSEQAVICEVQRVFEELITQGRVRIQAVVALDAPDQYCQLYPSMSSLSACSILLAEQYQGSVVTDSMKVFAKAREYSSELSIITSLELLKQWFEEEHCSDEEITASLRRTVSFFQPIGCHPFKHWWLTRLFVESER